MRSTRRWAAARGSSGAFPGETEDDDLEALRELFTRKALIARQSRVCEGMLADGWSREGVVSATVAQLPSDSADAVRALELREQLGIRQRPRTRRRSSCPTASRWPPTS